VRLREQAWGTSDQIRNLTLPLNRNRADSSSLVAGVSLNAVATPRLVPAQSPVSRSDGERLNTVQGFIERGVLPEEALKRLRADLAENPVTLPSGYHYKFGGDSDQRAEFISDLMAPIGLILAALMATIVLTFNSWRLSGIALIVCVCSMGLSLLSLAIFRYPFGIQALIGVIGSIGVSINAAIIIMTALEEHDSARHGNLFAIRSVVMDSSRHIVSTTVTTFGGFLPLILEGGQFWPPFAMAIAGGVLLSTIISLFLVPPMYVLARRGEKTSSPGVTERTKPRAAYTKRFAG
jgi:multidrug efflux pump subunit AcrB